MIVALVVGVVVTSSTGRRWAIMLRGRDATAPVLLHLAGGPGGTGIGAMRLDTGLEQHFVVATWDQQGTGTSYPAFGSAETSTLDRVVADTTASSSRTGRGALSPPPWPRIDGPTCTAR